MTQLDNFGECVNLHKPAPIWRSMTRRRKRDYASTLPRPLPAEVARTALLERVTRADDASLIMLIAPSGYGKTSFLGQVARASQHAAWLTLSERHTELQTLSHDLMASITKVAEEATFERVHKAVAEGAQVSSLATSFARELDELVLNLRILVDQANLLSSDALAWLESFALALGEGHQLIYCAYDLASERLAAPLASGSALLFTASDLAFSEDETRAYLNARRSSADVYQVHRDLEGWPAGVGLVAAGVEHVLTHDDLLSAAFDQLPEDVREALPEASVLEVWHEEDAIQLGCNLPKGWLKEARRAGLPMTPLSVQAYRPHTLVIEVLDTGLRARPERYRELHSKAGSKAEKHYAFIPALQHFKKAEQTQNAFRVAELLVPQLRKRAEESLICDLLSSFCETDLPPSLIAAYGSALIHTDQTAHGEKILERLRAQELGGFRVLISLSILAGRKGDARQMLALAEESLYQVYDEETRVSPLTLKLTALLYLGRYSEALSLIHELTALLQNGENRVQLSLVYRQIGRIYFDTEQYSDCEVVIRQAISVLEELELAHTGPALSLADDLGNVLRIQNRSLEAQEVLERAFFQAKQYRAPQAGSLLDSLADVLMIQTKFEQAAEYYKEAVILLRYHKLDFPAQLARYKLFDAVRGSGDHVLARRLLSEAHNSIVVEDHIYFNGLSEFYDALDAFNHKDMKLARQAFEAALPLLIDPEPRIRSQVYLLELARQENILFRKDVGLLVNMLDSLGHNATLQIDAEPLKPLYEELVTRGWYAERFTPFTKPRSIDTLQRSQPTLSIQTFKDVQLTLEGKPVKLPFSKATELLVWLALYGPAMREQIIDALWDGSRDLKHVEYGKLALRRLRTALAEYVPFNPLVYAERQYQLADELEVKLDVQDMLDALNTGNLTARREALERYDGTFLPGVTSEWAEAIRVELHDMALATAMGLGTSYEHSDVPSALWAYRKAVEVEPLFLDSYHALVRLLQASGDQVGARLAYQTYLRVLTTEYGETPDLTFDDLLHRVQSKHLN